MSTGESFTLRRASRERLAERKRIWEEAGVPYGECLCGCGARTSVAVRTRNDVDFIRGEPTFWLCGHQQRVDPVTRFRERVKKTDTCWLWASPSANYGTIRNEAGRTVPAHRWSYEHFVGPIPEGFQIDHLCRNPPCVNPDHLEAVTQRENIMRGDSVVTRWGTSRARTAA